MAMTEIVEAPSARNVEWGAILAGASIATALGLILLAFGAALGLSVVSPYEGEGLSPVAFATAAGLYLLWVQILSFFVGGYVTARLGERDTGSSDHEVDVRDGLRGLVTWAIGVIAAATLAFAGIGGAGAIAAAPRAPLTASIVQVASDQVNEGASAERADPDATASTPVERRAEITRKLTIIAGFITAASLLAGAVAAFFGAHSGGHHRDNKVNWEFFTSRARVRRST